MDRPTMFEPRSVQADVTAFISYFPLPGYGIVPINAFLLHAEQPVLVDTGYAGLGEEFMSQLRSAIDLQNLRWLYLTHADPDHIGNITQVLAEAPNARVVTTFLAMGKMMLLQLPVDRVYLLNPGQSLDVGDRSLQCMRPPTFDAPETTGFYDTKTGALFSADCFGALMSEPADDMMGISLSDLRDGLVTWATVDAPWLHMVDRSEFANSLDAVRVLDPSIILSSHLPPAVGMTESLLEYLRSVPSAQPFVGPDQAALERAMRPAA